MKGLIFLKGTTGLNNVADPVRIGHNEDTGIADLSEAYNVDIDDSGRISRRKGFTATARTENIHSMFAEGDYCLYVSGNSLYKLNPDYSWKGLRNYLTIGAVMDYAYVNSMVYYSNGFDNGYVFGETSYAWLKGTYYGATTFKIYSDPPAGHLICYYGGRMFVAVSNVVWYSEPFAFGAFDMSRNYFQFPSRIKMLKAVSDGLFVSDSKQVYSLKFNSPQECKQDVVHDYPVIEGSAVIGDAALLQLPNSVITDWTRVDGPVVVCATSSGVCVGASSGLFKCLTQDRVTYPSASRATALIKDNTYICLLQE